ncbi:hypothetical protein RSAG8_08630, partial [Rhizoctonia solani AG-8 WAC10335]
MAHGTCFMGRALAFWWLVRTKVGRFRRSRHQSSSPRLGQFGTKHFPPAICAHLSTFHDSVILASTSVQPLIEGYRVTPVTKSICLTPEA